MIFLAFLILWWVTGYYGFKFWWRHEFDLTESDQRMAYIIALMGPFTWIAGWAIHGGSDTKIISPKK